jgi:microsomal dipeptidase-like Zn-dependent dipeptidase
MEKYKLFFLHNHYIPRKLFCDNLEISSVIVPEFYPDLNYFYLGDMCYFNSLENYFDYMEVQQPYPCKIIYSLENISILHDINQLDNLVKRGLRIIQIFHTKSNRFFSLDSGLTDAGLSLLKKMEKLNMTLDLSHIPERLLQPIIEKFTGKMIVSHCACSDLYIDKKPRTNSLSKKSIELLSQFSVMFGVAFINDIVSFRIAPYNIDPDELFLNIVEQIEAIVSIAGIDHVAFGPDFQDTAYFSRCWNVELLFPEMLLGYNGYKYLHRELSIRYFSESDIERIFFLNARTIFDLSY